MADQWRNGIREAIERLREHAGPSDKWPAKFDTRDRAALAFILDNLEQRHVFAVVYSSYADDEVAGLYATRELADDEARRLSGMWEVAQWSVQTVADDDAAQGGGNDGG